MFLTSKQLIVITGLPCSGKSHRAAQIAANFESQISSSNPSLSTARPSILHIPSNHARLDGELSRSVQNHSNGSSHAGISFRETSQDLRNTIYNSAAAEKTARAEEFSAIKRAISKDTIVIADGLNYIKGYRYQLWCEAKAVGTRCCVVHVAAREDEVTEWNAQRLKVWGWTEEGEESDSKQKSQDKSTTRLGDHMPEGHTAIYGDRDVVGESRSRSSSMDHGELEENRAKRETEEDGMTLKSLYIRDEADAGTDSHEYNQNASQPPLKASHPTSHLPLMPPSSQSSPPYTRTTLDLLLMRYEPPSPFSRWDTPLFTVPTIDSEPPYDQIWSALFPEPNKHISKKALSQQHQRGVVTSNPESSEKDVIKPHAATVLPRSTDANALQTLESATGDVVTALLAAGRRHLAFESDDGGEISFSVALDQAAAANDQDVMEISLTVPPGTSLNQPTLQRLRRRYLALQRAAIAHNQRYVGDDRRGAVVGFVGFLRGEFGDS